MQIEDRGKNNRITVNRPTDAPGSIIVKGNDTDLLVGRVNGRVDITVEGNGCKLVIENITRSGILKIGLKHGGSVSIGDGTTVEDCYILAERAHVRIGKDCMISFQVNIRTTDAHGIYDLATGNLLNKNEDVVIDDHVWLAQGVMIAKGTRIGRDCIVGAKSYLSKIDVKRNSLVAGTPPRVLREGVIWDRRMAPNIYKEGANIDPRLLEHLKEQDTAMPPKRSNYHWLRRLMRRVS